MAETNTKEYDRWSVRDDSEVEYGHLGKTAGAGIIEGTGGFYITTAINYTNGPAHMGHAYEATTADVIARYHRLKGDQPSYFVTGADEHGQKIANTAADKGEEPIDICNKVSKSPSKPIASEDLNCFHFTHIYPSFCCVQVCHRIPVLEPAYLSGQR